MKSSLEYKSNKHLEPDPISRIWKNRWTWIDSFLCLNWFGVIFFDPNWIWVDLNEDTSNSTQFWTLIYVCTYIKSSNYIFERWTFHVLAFSFSIYHYIFLVLLRFFSFVLIFMESEIVLLICCFRMRCWNVFIL